MKQLFEIKPNTPCYVNPKLPKLTVKIVKAGSSTTAKVDYDALYTAAYNKLDTATQAKITAWLTQTTMYSCYPCKPADSNAKPEDWYNFVKYCTIKGDTSTLDTYALTWSGTTTTGSNTITYTPDEATRVAALNVYNNYVADNGATTGVTPLCGTVSTTDWTNQKQTASAKS
jgi:hypothetical protein